LRVRGIEFNGKGSGLRAKGLHVAHEIACGTRRGALHANSRSSAGAGEPEQWHPEAGSSWPSWPKASLTPTCVRVEGLGCPKR